LRPLQAMCERASCSASALQQFAELEGGAFSRYFDTANRFVLVACYPPVVVNLSASLRLITATGRERERARSIHYHRKQKLGLILLAGLLLADSQCRVSNNHARIINRSSPSVLGP
jgi:hypothetical protein